MRRLIAALAAGFAVGVPGGLIGLGGAEFRLPLLIGPFGFAALDAVILNKATSLLVVMAALPARSANVPLADVLAHGDTVINLLCGSLAGAWIGAGWALRLSSAALHRVIAVLLLAIAAVLVSGHGAGGGGAALTGTPLFLAGLVAGFGIGIVASLLGVAGGEFLIPTLVLLFGLDVKLAGSLSLAISLPTMLVGLARYGRDARSAVLWRERRFLAALAAGSVAGVLTGAGLLGIVASPVLLPLLAAILVLSAAKLWRSG